jgi:hypothetical protein
MGGQLTVIFSPFMQVKLLTELVVLLLTLPTIFWHPGYMIASVKENFSTIGRDINCTGP